MDCDRAQFVITLYLSYDPDLSSQDREELKAHLQVCPDCAREYRESRWVISLLKEYATASDDTRQFPESKGPSVKSEKRPMTVEEGWEDLKRRLPDLALLEKQQNRKKFIIKLGKVAAMAASIVLVFTLGWLVGGPYAKHKKVPAPFQVARPTAYAELITPSGKHPLPLGKPFATVGERREVILGGIHRVVMNRGTRAAFDADTINGKAAYNIQLAQGELYVEVIPGHPFTVKTPNARLNITGTKFDVRYNQNRTDLALVKGSIRFVNAKNSWTDVTAGHSSAVCGKDAPAAPTKTDTLAVTAWARDTALQNALARVQPVATQESLLKIQDLNMAVAPPKLDTINYSQWMENKRGWFQREFPWIFKAEKALNDQGAQTDYITLLMVSGDIWQFNYPRPFDQPVAVFNPAALKRIASYYKVNEPWLAKTVSGKASFSPSASDRQYKQALEQWQSDISNSAGRNACLSDNLTLFTLRATNYLIYTHLAAYLWIKTHPSQAEKLLTDAEYASILPSLLPPGSTSTQAYLDYLETYITTAQAASTTSQELLLATNPKLDCSSPFTEQSRRLRELISSLIGLENKKDGPKG